MALSAPAADTTIRAAGSVLWRPGPTGEPEIALVHRPKYDDWSLPKGKCDPGEHPLVTARREVAEETGYDVVLGVPLPTQRYRVGERPKEVRYWSGRARGGAFTPGPEVDELAWSAVPEAAQQLSHPRDAELVREFAGADRDTHGLVVVRHAESVDRAAWSGADLDRPLDGTGRGQAARLRSVLAAYDVDRVLTSPARRCVDTVRGYADDRGRAVETVPGLAEDAPGADRARALTAVSSLLGSNRSALVCVHRVGLAALLDALADTGGAQAGVERLGKGEFVTFHLADGKTVAIEHHRS